jgi:GDPmannose 4,6-dehydratase
MAAANIRLGNQDFIELGNLEAKRDWGHAEDYVKAMYLMLQQKIPDDYVISTGETHSVQEFLNEVWAHARIGDPTKHLKINSKYFRPQEVPYLLGDCSKAKKILGWEPKYNFGALAKDMYDSDYNKIVIETRKLK